jgi:hypothetical protein
MPELPDLEWTQEELASLDCHDARLQTRCRQVLATLEAYQEETVPADFLIRGREYERCLQEVVQGARTLQAVRDVAAV